MMKKIVLLLWIFFPSASIGCDCLWGGSFLHSINNADIAIVGTVIGYDQFYCVRSTDSVIYRPTIMIIKVEELLFANYEKLSYLQKKRVTHSYDIRVLGNIEDNCSPDIDKFIIGTKWIFKMTIARENYYNIDFVLSDCATNYLEVVDNIVIGNIEGERQELQKDGVVITMSIDELRRKIFSVKADNSME